MEWQGTDTGLGSSSGTALHPEYTMTCAALPEEGLAPHPGLSLPVVPGKITDELYKVILWPIYKNSYF